MAINNIQIIEIIWKINHVKEMPILITGEIFTYLLFRLFFFQEAIRGSDGGSYWVPAL